MKTVRIYIKPTAGVPLVRICSRYLNFVISSCATPRIIRNTLKRYEEFHAKPR